MGDKYLLNPVTPLPHSAVVVACSLAMRPAPCSVIFAVLLLAVAVSAQQTYDAVSWSVQYGRGCAGAKTVGVFYFPTGICYNNGTDSYLYSCSSAGAPANTSYSGTQCAGTGTTVQLPMNCQNNASYGYFYGCHPTGPQTPPAGTMRLNDYGSPDCSGPVTLFVEAAQGQCIGSFGESFTVSCDAASNEVTFTSYPGSVNCNTTAVVNNGTSGVCASGTEVFCPGQGNSGAVSLVVPLLLLSVIVFAVSTW